MYSDIVDALEHILSELAPVANDLNEQVEALAERMESIDGSLDNADLGEITGSIVEHLNQACRLLKDIENNFSRPSESGKNFIEILKEHFDSGTIGIPEGEFESVLKDEAVRLESIGLNEVVVNLVIQQMRKMKGELQQAHPFESPDNLLEIIKVTQTRICMISEYGREFVQWSPVPYLRAAAGGVVNVCVITGDALTPFVVHDPTLKSYVLAAKSVYSGFRKLKENGLKLFEGIQRFRRFRLRGHMKD